MTEQNAINQPGPAAPAAGGPANNQPAPPVSPTGGKYVDRSALGIPSIGILIGVGLITAFVIGKPDLAIKLSEPSTARGVIMLLISASAIGLAFLLVYQGILSATSDEQFRRGREIFTGMMGVLGTIVGFYFGSADRAAQKLELAEVKIINNQVVTNVSGGTKPYNYTLTFGDGPPIKGQSGENGWIIESFDPKAKSGKIVVTDGKKEEVVREFKISPEGTPGPTATPGGGATNQGGSPDAPKAPTPRTS